MKYATLKVTWSERESAEYYINFVTCGFNKQAKTYWLKSFSGTYTFNPTTRKVTLDTGTETRDINVIEWSIFD